MSGPDIPWLPGRTDYVDDSKLPPRGRLPDAAQGSDHIRHIFYRMGFNDQEIVALSGAHNLGRCHTANSGFEGKWVNNPTRFSNQYFRLLVSEDWKEKTLPSGIVQFAAVDPDTEEELMMLPTDLALVKDEKFLKWVKVYAEDKDAFFEDFKHAFHKLMELGSPARRCRGRDKHRGATTAHRRRPIRWASLDRIKIQVRLATRQHHSRSRMSSSGSGQGSEGGNSVKHLGIRSG